ncbi:hypothetical protein RHMOL_Rhmol04G0107300 [Rhododendron molle]|uniref:Uncharacterized protein n=1 Tax=Rhododendron molle TaxID=49168 RepID=A0ACC0P0B4_RHOML|nr:hypothetical protein RHMOL_Rhmol04G0107300 [Rhododendron molle]
MASYGASNKLTSRSGSHGGTEMFRRSKQLGRSRLFNKEVSKDGLGETGVQRMNCKEVDEGGMGRPFAEVVTGQKRIPR